MKLARSHPQFWLRAVLLAAMFLGILSCLPLWTNTRFFPVLPLFQGFPILPSPWDKLWLAMILLSLPLAVWRYRPAVAVFVVASLFAYAEDQNRGQPWFYMYWVMLLMTLLPDAAALAACRFSVSVIYFWSGIQKFNPAFMNGSPAWFVSPAAHWHLPAFVITVLRWSVATAPYLETAIAFALWIPKLRKLAIGAVCIIHVAALLFLGPLGHNYNWVVWPWNLAMIGLVVALFGMGSAPELKNTWAPVWKFKPALLILAPFALLPVLSFFGAWDSDFSFTLYSENQANANIFITQAFADRLPARLQKYVQPMKQGYDPQFQGPCAFLFGAWCYDDLHVPFVPEPRNFRAVYRFLRQYSKEPKDLRLIIGPRAGPVLFYEGDLCLELPRK